MKYKKRKLIGKGMLCVTETTMCSYFNSLIRKKHPIQQFVRALDKSTMLPKTCRLKYAQDCRICKKSNMPLDGVQAWLLLPPIKRTPVIRKNDFERCPCPPPTAILSCNTFQLTCIRKCCNSSIIMINNKCLIESRELTYKNSERQYPHT